jgi:hypothetical protein
MLTICLQDSSATVLIRGALLKEINREPATAMIKHIIYLKRPALSIYLIINTLLITINSEFSSELAPQKLVALALNDKSWFETFTLLELLLRAMLVKIGVC